jgi:hypothetical protein
MRAKGFGAAGLVLLETISSCGLPQREGLAGAEGFSQGELFATGGSVALYSMARATDDVSHRWRESRNRRGREDDQDSKADDR